ncbi:hypothetical protein C8R42DRAFT_717278 [Lentinula raphanica]|nr:hypothetical protein C8R42DRAFT_717278 [Lentinula raphanica]
MSTVGLYLPEDDSKDSQPATRQASPSPEGSGLSESSVWSGLSDWDPYILEMDARKPTCVPSIYDGPGTTKKSTGFYNVYVGDLPGCYRDWASAGGRVTGFPNNLHKKYNKYEEAMEGWKQYCLGHHCHAEDFVDGSTYQPSPRASSLRPSVVPAPSNHNVVTVTSPSKESVLRASSPFAEAPLKDSVLKSPSKASTSILRSSPTVATPINKVDMSKSLLKSKLPVNDASPSEYASAKHEAPGSPSKHTAPGSPSKHTTPASPSKQEAASSTISSPSSLGSPLLSSGPLPLPRRLWAIHTNYMNCVVQAEEADGVLKDARNRGEMILIKEVNSIMEAEMWLNHLEHDDRHSSQKRKIESLDPLEGLQVADFGLNASSSSSARSTIVSESLTSDKRRIIRHEVPVALRKTFEHSSATQIEDSLTSNSHESLDPIPADELITEVPPSPVESTRRYRKSTFHCSTGQKTAATML